MTPEQTDIVKATWARVVPIADVAADLFYKRLFELDPKLEQLFANVDLDAQKKKLLSALAVAVKGLDAPEGLRAPLAELGRRHAGYGVKDSHYDTVGQALIQTLETGLGDAWNDEVRDAWLATYSLVTSAMQAGASAGARQAAAA